MTTVKNVRVGETPKPAEAAQKSSANGILYVTDSLDRKIGLKKPTPGDRFELDDAIATKTQSAAMQVTVVGCLISIDEEGYPPLWTYDNAREEFKKRLGQLGDEGLMAITPAALKLFGIDLDEKDVTRVKK